ncbi:Phage major capsid protein E [Cetobacterium ceti]|uniref:Phage major capsid protein E n=1 Tax=Cetobacterium ceti TaxID=180163 RepID=A0A1T4QCR0_9FUSO|nr:major capsid protein [Cetobacterium ceti]SKA01600.1 Phage major capsid protein E [Cetobacterium ceti]
MDQRTLILALKQTKAPELFLYNLLIGAEKCEKTEKFEIQTKSASRTRVPLVGRRENGKLIKSESYYQSLYKPGIMKPYKPISEDSLLAQKFGQDAYGTPASYTNMQLKGLKSDLLELKEIGLRTKLWMLSQLLVTGTLPTDKTEGISFGELNETIMTGSEKWSDPTAPIISQLRQSQLKIQQNTGMVVDHLIVTPDVVEHLLANNGVKEAMKSTTGHLFVFDPEKIGDNTAYIGFIPELNLRIFSYMDWTAEEGEVEQPLLPPGTALLLRKKSFRVHYAALAIRKKAGQSKTLIQASEYTKVEYGTKDEEDDVLRYYSAPLIIPVDAQGWALLKVLGE